MDLRGATGAPGKEAVMAANDNGQTWKAPNGIFLAGNLVKDPELKYTPSGTAVVSLRIAVDGAGNGAEDSGFFTCTAWNALAENLAESLVKGQRVLVAGTIRNRSYEIEGGKKRSSIEIAVTDAGPSLVWATAQVSRKMRTGAPQASEAPLPEPVGA